MRLGPRLEFSRPEASLVLPAACCNAGRLSLIWAGTFSVRKGAHFLLEAWREGRLGRHARLRVFDTVGLADRVLQPLPEGIEFLGSVPRTELLEHYRQADAMIFPTLCDRFGLVATEAWSRGVPGITTDRAGATDLLRPRNNRLIIKAGDAQAIVQVVEWCQPHRPELRAMREVALATAANWQCSDYRTLHTSILRAAGLFGPTPGSSQ